MRRLRRIEGVEGNCGCKWDVGRTGWREEESVQE
jgi:hypothetical protein